MKSIYNTQYQSLLSDSKSPSSNFARMVNVSQPSSGLWLTTVPFHPSLQMTNSHFSIASRIRLGLTPIDNLTTCSCSASLTNNPLHFLDCRLLRSLIIARHHRIIHTFARISRLIGIAVVLEPRIGMDDMSRTDANFFLSSISAQTDACVVHPSASSYLKLATKPSVHPWTGKRRRINFILVVPMLWSPTYFPWYLNLIVPLDNDVGTSSSC